MFDSTSSAQASTHINNVPFKDKYPSIEITTDEVTIEETDRPHPLWWLNNCVYIKIKAKDGRSFEGALTKSLAGLILKDRKMKIWFSDPDHLHRYITIVHIDLAD